MTYKQSIVTVFNNYANFRGRASRSEFWYFYLFTCLVSWALLGLSYIVGSVEHPNIFFSLLSYAFSLLILIPSLAVAVRRMHDIGRGGGWIFIALVPVIGWIWYIVLAATPSEPGENRFGPRPE